MKIIKFLCLFCIFAIHSAAKKETHWLDIKKALDDSSLEQFTKLLYENLHLINNPDKLGMTFLMHACAQTKLCFVEKLIELGAHLELENDFIVGKTALEIARYNKSSNIENILKTAGARK